VILFNHTDEAYYIKRGDRIAQLVLERIHTPEVEVVTKLWDTDRGADGFGSTGQ
jgi:dUTP diphosphatase